MRLTKPSSSWLVALTSISPVFVSGASTTTKTTTSTASFLLPSRSTSLGYHIYATPITSDATTTEYLLACQTQFRSSYTCGGDFTGLTLTYGPGTMHLNLGPSVGLEYGCALSPTAVCTVTSSGIVATSTVMSLAASETLKSLTPITILGNAVVTTSSKASSPSQSSPTSAVTTTTSGSGGSGVCKRKVGSGGNGSGSGATAAGDADATAGDAATATGAGGCSAGTTVEFEMAMFGITAFAVVIGMVVL